MLRSIPSARLLPPLSHGGKALSTLRGAVAAQPVSRSGDFARGVTEAQQDRIPLLADFV
jgi:hypothetical protein